MNEMYNERVASFKKNVQSQEANIIEGKIIIETLNQFIELHEEVENYVSEYYELVNDGKDQYKEKLEEYLKEELDYLELITNLLNNLANYHVSQEDISREEIEKEWSDVRIMVTVQNIKKALKRAESLRDKYPQEKYDDLTKRYESLLDKAIEAENNLLQRAEKSLSEPVVETKDEKLKYLVRMDTLEEFSNVYEKINYVQYVLESIEHVAGKKRTILVNGERKNINVKYASRYLSYVGILNNLYLERDKEEEQLSLLSKSIEAQLEKEIDAPCIDSYWKIKENLHENQVEVAKLISRVTSTTSNEEAINVTLYNGNSARILKTDIAAFEALEAKINDDFSKLEILMKDYGIEIDKQELTDDEKKQEIIEKINFLKQTGISGEALDNQIKELVKEYQKVEKRKRFTSVAGLTRLFLKQGYSKEEAIHLAEIAYDPSKIEKNKEIKDEDKKNIFKMLCEYFVEAKENFIEAMKLIDEDLDVVFYDEPEEDVEDKKASKKEKVSSFWKTAKQDITSLAKKTRKSLVNLPKKAKNYVSKITGAKKPKNKNAIKEHVKKCSKSIAFVLGAGAIMAASATSNYEVNALNNHSTIEKENPTKKKLPNVFDENLENETNDQINSLFGIKRQDHALTVEDMVAEVSEKNQKRSQSAYNGRAGVSNDLYSALDARKVNPTANAGITNALADSIDLDKTAEMLGDQIYEMSNQQEIDLDDTFTVNNDSQIYANEYDAAYKTNPLKPYFGANEEREVNGIVYNYNGTMVLLDKNDPDFESQRAALESNGAVLEAVRSQVGEKADKEGFWNIDDINEKDRSR